MPTRACRWLPILIICAILLPALAPEGLAATLQTIQTQVAKSLRRPGARSADWGIQIVDPASGDVLLEVNPDRAFLPASVLKVVTTSTALEKLGPDFRFRTGVYSDEPVEPGGTVPGNLILVGRGDPNLLDSYGELLEKSALQELAEKLQSLGVKKIRGDVIGDDSYFDCLKNEKGWSIRDLRSSSGDAINALSINNNALWVQVQPTKRKRLVYVTTEPRTSYFHIRNLATTGSSRAKKSLHVRMIPGTNTVVVSGILPLNRAHSQYLAMAKPAEVAATMLKEELQKLGIVVEGDIRVIHSGDIPSEQRRAWQLLAEHKSPPLIRALEIINKRSQNLHAEMLLGTLGAEFKGEGTNDAGLQVVNEFLEEAGINSAKIQLSDGCGLSRENLVTPRFQTSLLEFLSKRPYFGLFINTLAVSGTDGTLKNRLSGYEVRGSIHAKTGTLNGVTTLAGYMTTRSGRNLVFSIFANRVRAEARVKRTIDEICSIFVNLY